METLRLSTSSRIDFLDITSRLQQLITDNGWEDGVLTLFVPHTTAGITINENADPDVVTDMTKGLNKLVPFEDNYRHMEGNSAAHIKSSLFSCSLTIIIENMRPVLGTWQGVYFADFDGPRQRKLYLKFISA